MFYDHYKFKEFINNFVSNSPQDFDESSEENQSGIELSADLENLRLDAFLTAVLDRLKPVVIVLDNNGNAQEILQCLNHKSKVLNTIDLVKKFYLLSSRARRGQG